MTDSVAPPAPIAAPAPSPLPHSVVAPGHARQQQTARDFEAVFLSQMTQLMMESVEPADGFAGGHGETMFSGIMAEKIGQEIARKGGIGLAPVVLDQIIKMQGGQ